MEKKLSSLSTPECRALARTPLKVVELDTTERSVTVRVPFSARRRGGRKIIAAEPGSAAAVSASPQADASLVTALARVYLWKTSLDRGDFGSMTDLAKSLGIDKGYLSRSLELTLLAPKIIESILDARTGSVVSTATLTRIARISSWADQAREFAATRRNSS